MTHVPNEIGAAVAIDIQRLQRSGYRGPILLRDPGSGNVVVFNVHETGCKPLGNFPYTPEPGEEHLILMMPELDLSVALTPKEVFALVEKQVRRLSGWTVH